MDNSPELSGARQKSGDEPSLPLNTLLKKNIKTFVDPLVTKEDKQTLATQLTSIGRTFSISSLQDWELGIDSLDITQLEAISSNYADEGWGNNRTFNSGVNRLNTITAIMLVNIGTRTSDLEIKKWIIDRILYLSKISFGFSCKGLEIMLIGLPEIVNSAPNDKVESFAYQTLEKLLNATSNHNTQVTHDQREAIHNFVKEISTPGIRKLFMQEMPSKIPSGGTGDHYNRLLEIASYDELSTTEVTIAAIKSLPILISYSPDLYYYGAQNLLAYIHRLYTSHPDKEVHKHAQRVLLSILERLEIGVGVHARKSPGNNDEIFRFVYGLEVFIAYHEDVNHKDIIWRKILSIIKRLPEGEDAAYKGKEISEDTKQRIQKLKTRFLNN